MINASLNVKSIVYYEIYEVHKLFLRMLKAYHHGTILGRTSESIASYIVSNQGPIFWTPTFCGASLLAGVHDELFATTVTQLESFESFESLISPQILKRNIFDYIHLQTGHGE